MYKKRLLSLIVFCFLFCGTLFAADVPEPTGWVNDFANVLSKEDYNRLTTLIQELEEKTSAEIAVVTMASIAPYGEEEYARLLFDSWKPGKKGKDNGVLILLAIKERRWRIETGYGIEGTLPDGRCGMIGRDYMVPYFKEGRYGEGLYNGVLAIYQILSGGQDQPVRPKKIFTEKEEIIFAIITFVVILILFIVIFFTYYEEHKGRRDYYKYTGYRAGSSWGGFGGFGGGGGFGGFGGGCGGGGGAGGGF